MEEAIKGDIAFIRAWKVDEAGNAIFRYKANTSRARWLEVPPSRLLRYLMHL